MIRRSATLALLMALECQLQPTLGYHNDVGNPAMSTSTTTRQLSPGREGYRAPSALGLGDLLGVGGDSSSEETESEVSAEPVGLRAGHGSVSQEAQGARGQSVEIQRPGTTSNSGAGARGDAPARFNAPGAPTAIFEAPANANGGDDVSSINSMIETTNILVDSGTDETATTDQAEEAEEVVQMIVSLELPEGNTTVITQGDLEIWLCYLDALFTKKLAFTSSRSHVVVLVAPYETAYDAEANTITIEAVSSNDPEQLLRDLKRTVNAIIIDKWFQSGSSFPNDHPLYNATIVDWEGTLAEATIATATNQLLESFSSADCGVARVSMRFGFFDNILVLQDNSTEAMDIYEADVENLMCSSGDYLTTLFGSLEEGSGIEVTIDRVLWDLEYSEASPLTVHFDLQAIEPGTGRRVAPVALLEWLAESDMQYYVQQAVWTALPYEDNIFFNSNGVFFDAVIRYLKTEAPEQTMSTLDCVDGVYDPASDQEEEEGDPFLEEVTTWTLHFGFEDGFQAREPSHEEMQGLFCATFFYYKDIFQPVQSGPNHAVVYTNLTMDAWEYSFTGSDEKPVSLYIDAQAWSSRGARVNPAVLRGQMQQRFNISAYIADYVWKSEPEGANVMRYTKAVHVDPGVRERHSYLHNSLNSSICYRETQAPSEIPSNAPSESPSVAPTGTTSAPTAGPTDGSNGGAGNGIGGIGGLGLGIGGGGSSNGGINNGPQELGSGGFAELGAGTLDNRPDPTGEEGGTDGGIGGVGGIGSGSGDGSGGSPTKATVPVNTGFIAIHLPSVPVSDGSDYVSDALADMFTEMIAAKPRSSAEPSNRRRLELEAEFDKDSVQIGNVTEAKCSHYYDIDDYSDDMVCSEVDVRFDVIVTGAESQDDLDAIQADYKNMTDYGIENGQFQESLNEVAPDSGWLVTDDREPAEVATTPPGPQTYEVPEPETESSGTLHPITPYAPKPRQKPDQEEDDSGIPLWALIVCTVIVFILLIVTATNIYYCCVARDKRHSSSSHYDAEERSHFDADERWQDDGGSSF